MQHPAAKRSSLFVAASHAADWRLIADAVGARLIDIAPLSHAAARLDALVAVDVLLLDCRGRQGDLASLISHACTRSNGWGGVLIVIADLSTLDIVDAIATGPQRLVLCEPDDRDILIALKVAFTRRDALPMVHEGEPGEPGQFDRLSGELDRLSGIIESLLNEMGQARPSPAASRHVRSPIRSFGGMPPEFSESKLDAQQVRALLRARRLRDQLLPGDLFADPAWDMMLDLMAARLEGNRVSVSSLCIAAAVPPTTALRWIRQLTERGLLERHADSADGRRVFIALSSEGYRAIAQWFDTARPMMIEAAG